MGIGALSSAIAAVQNAVAKKLSVMYHDAPRPGGTSGRLQVRAVNAEQILHLITS
jgi:hypothetical protein